MPDTITALASAPGTAGISVVRISGPDAIAIADKYFLGKAKLSNAKTHTIHFGEFVHNDKLIDTVTASVFIAPQSYTGEDIVEISSHGSMIVVDEILHALTEGGARLADAGEFTKRAFINGKLDLMQVEAVADIIHSSSVKGVQTSARQLAGKFTPRLSELRKKLIDIASLLELELDFADEDIEFLSREQVIERMEETRTYCRSLALSFKSAEILRSGYFVGIAGYPNSGKSTLFNTLLERDRAIVSEIPGTTRDYLEETIILNGISVRIIDTAGLRDTKDIIEIEGIKFVESVLEQSNLIIVLNDISRSENYSDELLKQIENRFPGHEIVLVHNKTDKAKNIEKKPDTIYISAKYGEAIEDLKNFLAKRAKESTERINDVLINQRHASLLGQVVSALDSAIEANKAGLDNTVISIDIRRATKALGEITGEIWSEEVLNNIFSRFCIGK